MNGRVEAEWREGWNQSEGKDGIRMEGRMKSEWREG